MPTIFIAVECCQCSTMQVKQRSKSSNKWTCVVCNQKQSVRQVFAQSPMAKHLRLFVQSSNMSRHFTHDQTQNQQQQQTHVSSNSSHNAQKKRPTDWTQYLDPPEDHDDDKGTNMKKEDELQGGGFEPEIVTELPAELFKKPKLSKYGNKLVFSQRHFDKHVVSQEDEEQSKYELKMTNDTSKSSHIMKRDDQETRTCQATKATLRGASKWNDYITQDDDDEVRLINKRKLADNAGQWSNERYKTIPNYDYEMGTNDERVEEDIHPDFLHGSVVSNFGAP